MPSSIRDLLARLAISRKEVAKAVGVSHDTVRGWASGRSEPTGENREKLLTFVEHHRALLGELAKDLRRERPD